MLDALARVLACTAELVGAHRHGRLGFRPFPSERVLSELGFCCGGEVAVTLMSLAWAVTAASIWASSERLWLLDLCLLAVQQVLLWVPVDGRPGEGVGPVLVYAFPDVHPAPSGARTRSRSLWLMSVLEPVAVID